MLVYDLDARIVVEIVRPKLARMAEDQRIIDSIVASCEVILSLSSSE